jgi:hypothetical protein
MIAFKACLRKIYQALRVACAGGGHPLTPWLESACKMSMAPGKAILPELHLIRAKRGNFQSGQLGGITPAAVDELRSGQRGAKNQIGLGQSIRVS